MAFPVTPYGYSVDSCGYCKDANGGQRRQDSRASYYAKSKRLSTEVYQTLIDRGWRRSGKLFYKPDNLRHCCPHYTIRLPVAQFAPGREHRQVVNRWNRHILGEEYIKAAAKLHPKSKKEKAEKRNSFDIVKTIHESEYANVERPPEPALKFEVILEPDTFTQEKYDLFKNYQQHVHHETPEEITSAGFERFLCASPLVRSTRTVNGKTQKLGSYHQCYRLDGRLIAMGVLDLLPHGVSGVYMAYHSDFEKWSFGKLSAVREIALTLEGGYQYYYMGYYIHSCVKMRYKGAYKPSYLLDPETYEWNLLDGELRSLLDRKPYVSLSRERRKAALSEGTDGPVTSSTDSDSKDEDLLQEFPLRNTADVQAAIHRGMSLFDLKVPGFMTAEEVQQGDLLDTQAIVIRGLSRPVEGQDLVSWENGDVNNPRSLKGVIAELIAALGPDAARAIAVDFS